MTEYPEWAPKVLCKYHQEWITKSPELKNLSLEVLEKMITDPDMQLVWESLEWPAGNKSADDYAYNLFMLVQNTDGPYGAERLKKRELRKAVERIEKMSGKLADLINQVMPYATVDKHPPRPDNLAVCVVSRLGHQARQILDEPRLVHNPGAKYSAKNYFVRGLASFFTKVFGDPKVDVIVDLYLIFAAEDRDENFNKYDVTSILRHSRI